MHDNLQDCATLYGFAHSLPKLNSRVVVLPVLHAVQLINTIHIDWYCMGCLTLSG
jgi:hypothetical protein